jgi:hypothetical protein
MNSLYNLTPDAAAALADPQIVVFLVFPSGHDIRLDLLDRARRSIPMLERGRDYTLREIVGKEWWDATLPLWHRITGGETFAFLVARGEFDLEFACHPERSNKIYRRL